MKIIEHWIAAKVESGRSSRTAPVWDPATGRQIAEVVLADQQDVQAAITAASDAFNDWSQSSLARRSKVLFAFRELVRAHCDELADIIVSEHGKVCQDAQAEIQRGLDSIDFACGIANLLKGGYSDQVSTGVDCHSFRQPLGVVVGITPFNFPMMIGCWMHPLAIACGNTFILKPSERVPSAAVRIAQLWTEAGLPDGVFNVVHGDRVAVETLLDSPDVAAVSFVGSTAVARQIHQRATANGKRVQALGGAKNHAVVLPDADMELVAEQLGDAAFGSTGQRCMSISAVVAVGDAGDRLVETIAKKTATIQVGPGHDPHSDIGPLINADAKDRTLRYIESGQLQGASVVADGRGLVVVGHEEGYFVGPTVLDHVTTAMDVYRDEIFGPVLVIVRVATLGDAIAMINANPYGNGTAIYTNAGRAARHFERTVRVGMIGVNVPVPVPMAYHSFGGWKDSLFGENHIAGPDGVHFYTDSKVVTTRWPHQDDNQLATTYGIAVGN